MSLKTVYNRLSPLAQAELENSLRIEMRGLSKKVEALTSEREEWSKGVDLTLKQGDVRNAKYDVVLKELSDTLELVKALGLVEDETE